ncbi:DUF3179 domain-containing (seleno)protein [Halomicrococcus sp. NG-SE-24]|uniref:DUF3179 domain-containing (seleno)protein n=1 Tax=Halomicrococcus sp. NG-SE-24 TaxID=3436928 RepID=UPI003D9A046B
MDRDERRDGAPSDVNRRAFLASVAGAGGAGVAGCFGRSSEGGRDGHRETQSRTTSSGATETAGLASRGIPATICEEEPAGGIDAIVDPLFAADWSSYDVDAAYGGGRLSPDDVVVGIETDRAARAYPLTVLDRHEVVNDAFGGPLLVTYCPICRSGVVAERVVDGEPTAFSVTGLLWQPPGVRAAARNQSGDAFGASSDDPDASLRNSGNLVMRDEATGSYWSQLLARAICGPRTGDELAIRASTVATWEEWRTSHSTTDVLVPPPHSGTL